MKLVNLVTVFIFFHLQLLSQEQRLLNGDSLLRDYEILKTSLIENHPLFGLNASMFEFETLSLKLEKQISKGQTLSDFHKSLSELINVIGCGHTYIYPSIFSSLRLKFIKDLPFDISVIRDSIYIQKVYGDLNQNYKGALITALNQSSCADFIKFVYHLTSSEGDNLTYQKYRLQNKFNYYLNEFLNYPDSIVFETNRGTFKINFPTNYTKPVLDESPPTFESLESNTSTVLLSIPNFDERKSTIKTCFKFCAKNNVENLIIDLRNNGGGNGNIGSVLLSYLIDTTHVYYLDKKISPFKHKAYFRGAHGLIISNQFIMRDSLMKSYYFKVKPQKKNTFKGNIYVLINGGTFSSAAYVASVLKHKTKSIFIGEETGGSEYAIGGGMISKLSLPNSKLSVKFPLFKWNFNTCTKSGHGTLPDVIVNYKITDLLNNNDLELERALELIKIK
ncbi:S41 family peptidase [Aurantibacillus circumpalustris]|uniref:S41 family peptidase n=1 Tax=Aurantibacillus circumpalustris TaxID=3036359 RepID=UPI00295B6A81|nr:S41 family peptidase [Aurantibacillus circumpalustris]